MIWNTNLDSVKRDGVEPSVNFSYQYFQNQCTVDFDSEEGIKIIDKWVDDWKNVLNTVYKKYGTLFCDLSGGTDTRVLLVLVILAGLKDKTVFYTKSPKICKTENQKPIKQEDLEIAKKIKEYFNLKETFDLPPKSMPRICGLYTCMKSYQKSIPAMNWNNLNELCPNFKLIMDLWLAQHPDADIYDKKQMANEIAFNQWHDGYKIKRFIIQNNFVLCPFDSADMRKIKTKGYKLWKFFMEKYCPEMLQFELQGRGYIDEIIKRDEELNLALMLNT